MNETVTLGLIQMAMADDREANVEKAFAMARAARESGAELIVFPELFSGIYFCKYPAALLPARNPLETAQERSLIAWRS